MIGDNLFEADFAVSKIRKLDLAERLIGGVDKRVDQIGDSADCDFRCCEHLAEHQPIGVLLFGDHQVAVAGGVGGDEASGLVDGCRNIAPNVLVRFARAHARIDHAALPGLQEAIRRAAVAAFAGRKLAGDRQLFVATVVDIVIDDYRPSILHQQSKTTGVGADAVDGDAPPAIGPARSAVDVAADLLGIFERLISLVEIGDAGWIVLTLGCVQRSKVAGVVCRVDADAPPIIRVVCRIVTGDRAGGHAIGGKGQIELIGDSAAAIRDIVGSIGGDIQRAVQSVS